MGTLSRGAARAGVLGVCLALAAIAAPGYADEEPTLSLDVADSLTIAAGEQLLLEGTVRLDPAPELATLRDVAVVIDLAALDGVAEVTMSGGHKPCTVEGDTAICFGDDRDLDIHDGQLRIGLCYLRGVEGANPGSEVSLPVTITTRNFPGVSAAARLTKAGPADLRTGRQQVIAGAPGDLITTRTVVTNASDVPANGAVLMFSVPWQLRMERRFSNCGYRDHLVVCRLESALAAHTTYRLTGDLAFTIRDHVIAPSQTVAYLSWYTPDTFDTVVQPGLPALTPGTGRRLRLAESTVPDQTPGAGQPADPGVFPVRITGDNPVDFAAVGANLTGEPGQVRRLEVGLRNTGRAYADRPDPNRPSVYVEVRLPAGMSPGGPAPCDRLPRRSGYRCELVAGSMPGDRHLWTFRVRINQEIPDASGSVTVLDGAVRDSSVANNTAPIVGNPMAAPTPPKAPSPAASGTASPTPTGSASPTPTGSASPTPTGPGRMPVTGNPLTLLLGLGVAALASGALLYRKGRRRPA